MLVSSPPHPLRQGAIAALLLLIGVALFGGVAWRQLGLSDEERAAMGFRAARHCLLGDEEGAPIRRLRARAIARDLGAGEGWPERCSPPLDGLRRRLDSLLVAHRQRCDSRSCCGGDDRCTGLARLRDEVDKALAFSRYGTDFDPTDLDLIGSELGFSEGEVPEGTPPPAAALALIDPSAMTPLFEGNYLRLLTDPDGYRDIELLFYEQEERYAHCALSLVDDGPARCRDLDAAVRVGLAGELFAGEDGAPRRIYAQGADGDQLWRHALHDLRSGRELQPLAHRPQGGFVWRDGSIAWLGVEPPMQSLSLFQRDEEGNLEATLPIEPDGVSASPRLYHDEMIWAVKEHGRQRLSARHLDRAGLGEATVIAEIEGEKPPSLELCRSDRLLALLALDKHVERGARGVIVLRTRDWHAPHEVHIGSGRFGFTCQGETATLSWIIGQDERPDEPPGSWDVGDESPVTGSYHVHRLRCSSGGCQHDQTVLSLRRFSKSSRYVTGDLAEATVVMYRSPLGDVRMRLAPLEDLAHAPEVPLFDDPEHDGFGWDLERDPIFGRAGSMLVLLSRPIEASTDSSVYAFRVNNAGTVQPVDVAPLATRVKAP